jgi:hypothetical protein
MNDMNYINDCGASKVYLYIYLLEPVGLQIFKTFLLLYDNRPQKNAFNMLCCAGRGAGGPTGRGPGTARVMPTGGKETFICVFLEIYEIRYMKKVTEFR